MTLYHGGKQKLGKYLARIIHNKSIDVENNYRFNIKGYCEPFCGMLGVYQHIPELFRSHRPKLTYKAGDLNKSVIKMWNAVKRGWKPPTKKVNKTEYNRLKKSPRSSPKKGFIGHIQAYRGVYFGGYFDRPTNKTYQSNAEKITEIGKKVKNVSFKAGLYTQFSKLKGYIIYCDPPYENTQQHYKDESTKKIHKFDSKKFWEWCNVMAVHNIVFVSSYSAPKGTKKIWSKGREKLYILY